MRYSVVLAALIGWAAPVFADPSDGITGAEARELVRGAMQAAGVAGAIHIAAARPLPACSHMPEIAPAVAGDWRSVDLRCRAPDWVRTLRTGATATRVARAAPDPEDGATGPGFVLNDSLARGAVIEAHHLEPAPAAQATAGLVTDREALIGRRLAVNLTAGRIILARHLEQDWLIPEGATVVIASGDGGFSVSVAGTALANGQRGDRIAVRNTRSGRVIEAEVIGPDFVRVVANMN